MLPHRAYPKISLTLDSAGVGDAHWVATEKIHGAQFMIGVGDGEVAFGKRKAWLADDEPFFGWQALRRELEHGARALCEALARPGTLYLYGELFGGAYPSASDEVLPGSTAVQTGATHAGAARRRRRGVARGAARAHRPAAVINPAVSWCS